jgi:membrane protease YdiL (CAAX protease family)
MVTAAYMALSHLAVWHLDAVPLLPSLPSEREAHIGSVFLIGALAQLLFVLAAIAVAVPGFREAARATLQTAPSQAWFIALAAAAIQCGTVVAFFIPDASRIFELSERNVLLTILPLTDGWTQEVMFRGYILLRLAKADIPIFGQIAASATAFASIHLGYIGSAGLGFVWPLLGTATLGGILAWSVVVARGSILPVTAAHLIIIAVTQPWLALAT